MQGALHIWAGLTRAMTIALADDRTITYRLATCRTVSILCLVSREHGQHDQTGHHFPFVVTSLSAGRYTQVLVRPGLAKITPERAHYPEVVGSNPIPATNPKKKGAPQGAPFFFGLVGIFLAQPLMRLERPGHGDGGS